MWSWSSWPRCRARFAFYRSVGWSLARSLARAYTQPTHEERETFPVEPSGATRREREKDGGSSDQSGTGRGLVGIGGDWRGSVWRGGGTTLGGTVGVDGKGADRRSGGLLEWGALLVPRSGECLASRSAERVQGENASGKFARGRGGGRTFLVAAVE